MRLNLLKEKTYPLYVIAGQRPLTSPVVNDLLDLLLTVEQRECNLDVISGSQIREDVLLERLHTSPFFPGRKVILLKDIPLQTQPDDCARIWRQVTKSVRQGDEDEAKRMASILLSGLNVHVSDLRNLNESDQKKLLQWPKGEPFNIMRDFFMKHELKSGPAPPETWLEKVLQRVSNAGPEKIVLIIETDIYSSKSPVIKKIKELGRVIEPGKITGRGKEREQAVKFIKEYLREEKKEIAKEAVQFLLENTGEGDLVSLKTELDKLIQLTGERPLINRQDVEEVSSRHREEEIFRITDAISRKETKKALSSLHLLLLQGIHPIAVFSAIVTFLRRMLALKTICEKKNMNHSDFHVSYQTFQKDFFPRLKQDSMHPYPLYKMFQHSSRFDKNDLIDIFLSLPEVDMELKGGGAQPDMVLERLIFQITVKNYEKSQ